ncbi:hypothetical protein [Paenibacillus cremeus]|uniref:Uncharacterized protein n=1 Tax=Paenibacillus cremeus TaxID=2163881 RepID=A0A559KCQ5_9BACL|nr:hypothetical protein [Paenibacillus cremeus]TVY09879.1 hypothetical protein FPZ49_10935 [Paenibacillus cremeus]
MNDNEKDLALQYADYDGYVRLDKKEIYSLIDSEKKAWELVELTKRKLNYIATITQRSWRMDDPIDLARVAFEEILEEIKLFEDSAK